MKKLLFVIIGTLTLVGALLPTGHSSAAIASANWQKTVIIQPRSSTDFSSSSFDQSVVNAINDGANYISLVVQFYQSKTSTTDIQDGANTPTMQSLQDAANFIHSKGAHVVFNLHDDTYDGQWRAYINPSDRTTWFTNYNSRLVSYAELAQSAGVEQIVIGTEMYDMTSPNVNSTNTANWQTMIKNTRAIYSGALTYSAQHDGTQSDLATLGFWPQLDYIGISAYYGLPAGSPSVTSIESSWAAWNNSSVKVIQAKYNKPVLFTEVGYQSKAGSLSNPGASYQNPGAVDLNEQANGYQALLTYWNSISYMTGVAFWDWSSDPNGGGTSNSDYTPQGKPAEQIMKQWFTTGGVVTPVGTPIGSTAYTATTTTTGTATAGKAVSSNVSVTASQPLSNALVDVEVYNSANQRVYQTFQSGQDLSTTAKQYPFSWTPSATGTYTIEVGVFTDNWASNLYWNGKVGTVSVGSTTTPITPPVTPPTTPVTPPTTNSTLSIWWPSAGTPVSGTQPFKAVLDGVALSSYTMYWQVDSGVLNQMSNVNDANPHKESDVDLSTWNWQASNQYTINFVAKDLTGKVITSKSVVIKITH